MELPPKYSPEVCFQHSSELTLSRYIHIITWLCLKLSNGSPPGLLEFSSVSSVAQSCLTLQHPELQHARLPCPSPTFGACSNSCPSSQWCHPTISSSVVPFSSCLQFFPASGSFLCIRWPKYPSFSFNISPSNEYSGLISFRIDWFDLLEVQGTLKSLLQHYSSKSSILQHSAFFIVQLSHPWLLVTYMSTIALTRRTFAGKVTSLLFNMLSRLVIAFIPRSKCLLISWLQLPSAVILEPRKQSLSLCPMFPHLLAKKWWDQMPWS